MGKIEECEGRKYLMTDNCMLDKVLEKIKMIIGIEKFDDAKILINMDDKLFSEATLKNKVLISHVMKDDGKFYPQIFLEEALQSNLFKRPPL